MTDAELEQQTEQTDEEPWWEGPEPCPVCGEAYDALMSGVIREDTEDTIELDGVETVCVEGGGDGYPVIYFHPEGE